MFDLDIRETYTLPRDEFDSDDSEDTDDFKPIIHLEISDFSFLMEEELPIEHYSITYFTLKDWDSDCDDCGLLIRLLQRLPNIANVCLVAVPFYVLKEILSRVGNINILDINLDYTEEEIIYTIELGKYKYVKELELTVGHLPQQAIAVLSSGYTNLTKFQLSIDDGPPKETLFKYFEFKELLELKIYDDEPTSGSKYIINPVLFPKVFEFHISGDSELITNSDQAHATWPSVTHVCFNFKKLPFRGKFSQCFPNAEVLDIYTQNLPSRDFAKIMSDLGQVKKLFLHRIPRLNYFNRLQNKELVITHLTVRTMDAELGNDFFEWAPQNLPFLTDLTLQFSENPQRASPSKYFLTLKNLYVDSPLSYEDFEFLLKISSNLEKLTISDDIPRIIRKLEKEFTYITIEVI